MMDSIWSLSYDIALMSACEADNGGSQNVFQRIGSLFSKAAGFFLSLIKTIRKKISDAIRHCKIAMVNKSKDEGYSGSASPEDKKKLDAYLPKLNMTIVDIGSMCNYFERNISDIFEDGGAEGLADTAETGGEYVKNDIPAIQEMVKWLKTDKPKFGRAELKRILDHLVTIDRKCASLTELLNKLANPQYMQQMMAKHKSNSGESIDASDLQKAQNLVFGKISLFLKPLVAVTNEAIDALASAILSVKKDK